MSNFKKLMGIAVLGAAAAGVALYFKKSQEDKLAGEENDDFDEDYFSVFEDEEAAPAPKATAEEVKETTEKAAEKAKETVEDLSDTAVQKTAEAVDSAEETADKAIDKAKEIASEAADAISHESESQS